MKIPISKRLLLCAELVAEGARVADIGTDHGYLGIYLLQNKGAQHVTACDLRPLPLQKARENAARFDVEDRMTFLLSDGLEKVSPDCADTIVCAGMGGDLIVRILSACSWIQKDGYRLVLQPQSAGQALRSWLAENGFQIEREALVQDGGFLYTVLSARFDGRKKTLTPGEEFVSKALRDARDELLLLYMERISNSLRTTVIGLRGAEHPRPERLQYYEQALEKIEEMRKQYAESI